MPDRAKQVASLHHALDSLAIALEEKAREAAEANEKYLRTYADFENYRKRTQRDQAEFRKYANEQLALELAGRDPNSVKCQIVAGRSHPLRVALAAM